MRSATDQDIAMDLHAWISTRVDAIERLNQMATDGKVIATILRRCEADRRVLARHAVDPAQANDRWFATACEGCGTMGDCDDPVTENINDCPELLDLAYAHGLAEDQLAALDRPVPPPVKPIPGVTGETLRERLASLLGQALADAGEPGPTFSGAGRPAYSGPEHLTAKKVGVVIRVSQEDLDHY